MDAEKDAYERARRLDTETITRQKEEITGLREEVNTLRQRVQALERGTSIEELLHARLKEPTDPE